MSTEFTPKELLAAQETNDRLRRPSEWLLGSNVVASTVEKYLNEPPDTVTSEQLQVIMATEELLKRPSAWLS